MCIVEAGEHDIGITDDEQAGSLVTLDCERLAFEATGVTRDVSFVKNTVPTAQSSITTRGDVALRKAAKSEGQSYPSARA